MSLPALQCNGGDAGLFDNALMRAFFSFRSEVAVDADALSDLLAHAANSTSTVGPYKFTCCPIALLTYILSF